MENNNIIKKGIKSKNKVLIISLIALLISFLLFYWIGEIASQDIGEPENLHRVIIKSGDKENIYSYIDIQLLTDEFATYGDGDSADIKYYYASDGDYNYIVTLTSATFNSLAEINNYTYDYDEDTIAPKPITITGMTKKISDDLKEIAIEMYNEMLGEEIVDEENFEDYLGSVYLCEGITPQDDTGLQTVGFFFAVLTFIICFIGYIILNHKTKKVIKRLNENGEFEKVEYELEKENEEFKKAKLAITESYIVDFSSGLDVIRLSDIIWIYPYNFRYNGITTTRSIIVVTSDKKKHKIATLTLGKKQTEEYNSIFDLIVEKVPNALVGYNRENIKEIKNYNNIN